MQPEVVAPKSLGVDAGVAPALRGYGIADRHISRAN